MPNFLKTENPAPMRQHRGGVKPKPNKRRNNVFKNCTTIDALKQAYRQLAMKHHPDKGGSVEMMQQVNAEYEEAYTRVRANEGATKVEVDEEWQIEKVFMDRIQSVAHLQGIIVELVGRWIWITGNTFPVKDQIKSAGFFWAKKKRAWFWRADEDRTRNRAELTLEEIRDRHGSKVVPLHSRPLLA